MTRYRMDKSRTVDIPLIRPQPMQLEEYGMFKDLDLDHYHGLAITLKRDGVPIGMAGLHILWPGVYESWAMLTRDTEPKEFIRIFRGIKTVVDTELATSAHRIQTKVRADFPQGIRMAEMLGMKQEGLLVKYSPSGVDYLMYSRTR